MAKDDDGREGLSTGAMAKELGDSPTKVKKALGELGIEANFVKSGCAYCYVERAAEVRRALAKS